MANILDSGGYVLKIQISGSFFFFWPRLQHVRSQFPNQGLN